MPETIVDLGKRVKAKYPGQYDDLSDQDLGAKVKAKYPTEYADFADVDSQFANVQSGASEGKASDVGVMAGVKRGLQNLNPLNVVGGIGQDLQPLNANQVDESNAQYQAGLQHFTEHPVASGLSMIPIVGPWLGSLAERAPNDTTGALAEALTTLGGGGVLAKALQKGGQAIPNKAAAVGKFETVMGAAKDVPLNLSAADDVALRAVELAGRGTKTPGRGNALPKVLSDYVRTREMNAPVTYEVGRDFAKNSGRLSASEKMAATGEMESVVAKFSQAMKDANREAASSVGMGSLYDDAMKEYHRAKTFEDQTAIAFKWAKRAAIAAGLGAAGKAGFSMYDDLTGR